MKLLYVEDEPDIRDVATISVMLDRTIEMTAFETCRAALATLRSDPQDFRFALLDLRLPTMTGVELHNELRTLPGMAGLQSVLITAAPETVTDEMLDTPGIVGVISKPFDPLTLARDVRSLFDA